MNDDRYAPWTQPDEETGEDIEIRVCVECGYIIWPGKLHFRRALSQDEGGPIRHDGLVHSIGRITPADAVAAAVETGLDPAKLCAACGHEHDGLGRCGVVTADPSDFYDVTCPCPVPSPLAAPRRTE